MADNKKISLQATYSVDDSFDSRRFIKLRVKVCHDGKNLNNSIISKEAIEEALPSLYNTPLLANVVADEDGNLDFGGHDMKLVEDAMNEGEYRILYKEIPVGVFPANLADACIVEEDGRNYLYASAYLWRRYSNYAEDIIKSREEADISMEILLDVREYDEEDEAFHINKFTFSGVTLLGATHTPAMEGACATTQFSAEDNDKLLAKLLFALEQEALCPIAKRKEGDTNLPEIDEVKVVEPETPIVEEPTTEDFTAEEPIVEETEPVVEEHEVFEASYGRKREAAQRALKSIIVRDENDRIMSESGFWVMDMNDNYILVQRSVHDYHAGKYSYDNGRFAYQYNEETDEVTLTSDFELMVCRWMTIEEAAKIDASAEVFEELEELRAYKRDKEAADVFAKFPDLAENEQFKALVADYSKFSIEELQRECYVIRGMAHEQEEFEAPKLPIRNTTNITTEAAPYGGSFATYGITPQNI